jgi:uncharacterized phage-like protein YoqJ
MAVTGYKPMELGIFSEKHPGVGIIKRALTSRMLSFVEEGTEWFVTSGSSGVELWASEVAILLKKQYPHVKLSILTPFLEQESRWPDHAKEQYYEVLNQADHVASITNRPYESPTQLRLKNEFIVQKSDGLLVLYDEESQGSPQYYLDAAKRRQLHNDYPIFYINRYDLEAIEREIQEQSYGGW